MTEIKSKNKPGPNWHSVGRTPAKHLAVWISLVIVVVISLLDLAGWLFNVTFLTSISSHWIPMKLITAICFIMTAVALMIIRIQLRANLSPILPRILASVICFVSILTIAEYFSYFASGKESSLTRVSSLDFFLGTDTRMALLTAINFFLIGCVLFLLSSGKAKLHGIGHIIIIPVSLISYFVPISYIIGANAFPSVSIMPVALNTGIAFCFVCTAIFLFKPDTWLLKVFMSDETGGVFTRRLLPNVLLLPIVIGWLRIHGEKAGLFGGGEGVALVALTYTFCFLALAWSVARSVNKIDLLRRSSEEALRLSEEKFKLIATNTPDHILVQDADLRYLYILNPQLGLREKDMIGKTDSEILTAEDSAALTKIKKNVLETGKTEHVDLPIVSLEGKTEYFEGVYVPKHNAFNQIDGIIGYFKNVTARRKIEEALRESEEQYRLLFNSMTEGFALHEIILDHDGNPCDYEFLSLNPAFEKLTGLKAENTIGKKVSEVLPENEPYWLEIYGKVALTGESTEFENYAAELKSYYKVTAFSPKKGLFAILFENITNLVLAEKELQNTTKYLENLINYANAPIIVWNPDTEIQLFNHAFERLSGYSSAEVEGKKLDMLFPKALLNESRKKIKRSLTERWQTVEIPIMTRDNVIRTVLWNSANIYDSDNKTILSTIAQGNDITERIKAESELQRTKNYLENLINYANAPIIVWNSDNEIQLFNHAFEHLTGYTSAEVRGKKLDILFPRASLKESNKKIKHALTRNWQTVEIPILTRTKEIRTVLWNSANIYDTDNMTQLSTIAQGNDITERINAELEVRNAKEKLDMALENANIGIWEWNINTDEVIWDERMEKIFGLEPGTFGKTFDAFASLLNEEDLSHVEKSISKALKQDSSLETVFRIKSVDRKQKYVVSKGHVIRNENGDPVNLVGACFDVTSMREGSEQLVLKLNEELLRSNKELEQFAYVASHDLQEPLRMVSSFTQLLSMRYKDKLDTEAQEFIKFAVDGAVWMQNLINALLEYSRVETRGKKLVATDMHEVLGQTINNMSTKIKEKAALITNDHLPVIQADAGQMVQLLQNLIGNAIKFCEKSPVVHISAAEEKDQYIFKIKDNGIGIEPQYFEKIFQIFQRLHPKEEYGGTGIGLAVCKRIVERHGGKIWVESKPGEGTSFIFTIKKS